jgi:dimeric dUTPase (all-alpha-NTP-PPase superfamily)
MNFKKLQSMQAKLDEAILADKAPMTQEERFNKTLVALSVEIAEVANCAEHFKFWKDNKGKIDYDIFDVDWDYEGKPIVSYYVYKKGVTYQISYEQAHRLTLIEECSDALHFILSLANQCEYEIDVNLNWIVGDESLKEYYYITLHAALFDDSGVDGIMATFLNYVKSLGIKSEELEQAYYDKNKINYERLENGY